MTYFRARKSHFRHIKCYSKNHEKSYFSDMYSLMDMSIIFLFWLFMKFLCVIMSCSGHVRVSSDFPQHSGGTFISAWDFLEKFSRKESHFWPIKCCSEKHENHTFQICIPWWTWVLCSCFDCFWGFYCMCHNELIRICKSISRLFSTQWKHFCKCPRLFRKISTQGKATFGSQSVVAKITKNHTF